MARREPDIRRLAQRQRWMIWLVLGSVISQFFLLAPLGSYGVYAVISFSFVAVCIHLFLIVGVILLLSAQGTHVLITILCAVLMIAPPGNPLVILFVYQSVTRTLKRAGLHVGLTGVAPDEVERVLDPNLCSACGYNLTGNVSGYCPECGMSIFGPGPIDGKRSV